ncbi:hypothetical protein D9Q98_007307 [Chlorella vulgaris]|uniref:histone deacetylase n=1 Tax=Chlorella vulgaris TaxID=3077 RepID=A0A9D4TLA8_CHLVU|nr:hypothetical protein D9Q98_007307 [Chlorella vulgaris]
MESSGPSAGPSRKNRVSYFYDPDIGQYYYGQGHPMKPHRVRMANSLVLHYGLHSKLDGYYTPTRASAEDMATFHSEDYIDFLRNVSPDNAAQFARELREYNMYEDCPVFDGLYEYCQIAAGGSLGAAVKLNYQTADIAINWAGGLHHAKRSEASGFCYVNDIVLAVLELLKYHQRVLYLDIDVHHGDGVEEAFLTTDRVMTVSFHKFGGGYFPGTGDIGNMGHGKGKMYALNVPLRDGITDQAYHSLFKPVVDKIMEVYQPEAVVLQCGTDSLAGDRLGVFNLSSEGHAACVRLVKGYGVPLMLLGGGGYKIINVARCWARETGLAVDAGMEEQLPPNEYYDYYGPVGYTLTVQPKAGFDDANGSEYLEGLRRTILQRLSQIKGPPSVGFHERAPDGMQLDDMQAVNLSEPGRAPQRMWDGELDPEPEPRQAPSGGKRRQEVSHRDPRVAKPQSPSMLPSTSRRTASTGSGGGKAAAAAVAAAATATPAASTQRTSQATQRTAASQGTQGTASTGPPGSKTCSNCGTSQTSSWRRDPETHAVLCSACGQYKKLNGTNRPFKLRQRSAASEEAIRQCSHCKATDTSNWRRHPQTREMLCNACGNYLKLHGEMRTLGTTTSSAGRQSAEPSTAGGGGAASKGS